MDYQHTLKYLYESVPMFQQIGGKAYKPGLDTTHRLDKHLGYPHRQFKTIHIAGTNGKGSCSHTIAAVLQTAGYKVGLYTSPHLVDFRERIRVNGQKVSEEYVVRFVEEHRSFFEPLHPSFFELTTTMAFRYFADQNVDVAVIEVGMGGRLDCTNIITPDLCVITNISFDHMQYLGGSLTRIAQEKAGIIKEGVPVVIGRASGATKRVFTLKAKAINAPLYYAQEQRKRYSIERMSHEALNQEKDAIRITAPNFPTGLLFELSGTYQVENSLTLLCALERLTEMGYRIGTEAYHTGFAHVCKLTGLMGRWQKLQSSPDLFCDTGHNVDGMRHINEHFTFLRDVQHKKLHIVFGVVNDKDISSILRILPQEATYYFTKASIERALPEQEVLKQAQLIGLQGNAYPTVVDAVRAAKENCLPTDFIFVGGSSFIVADLLTHRDALNLY